MGVETFLVMLVISAAATALGVQIVKQVLDAVGVTYKSVLIAVIAAFVVGVAEIFIYFFTVGSIFSAVTVIYAVCMGVANALGATTSYDLVIKFIKALFGQS